MAPVNFACAKIGALFEYAKKRKKKLRPKIA
jgi:hypothetical protein